MIGGPAFDWIIFAGVHSFYTTICIAIKRSREHREWIRHLPSNHVEQLVRSIYYKGVDPAQLEVILCPVRFATAIESSLKCSDPDRGVRREEDSRIRNEDGRSLEVSVSA